MRSGKTRRRIVLAMQAALLLAIVALCSACHRTGTELPPNPSADMTTAPTQEQTPQAEEESGIDLTLRDQALPLPSGVDKAQGQCYLDGRVYSFGNGHGPVVDFTALDGTTGTFAVPDEIDYIHAVCPAEGQLAVLAGSYPMYYEDADGTFHETEQLVGAYEILLYGMDGSLAGRIPLQQRYTAQTDAFFDLAYDGEGYVLLAPHQLTRIGADGAELCRSELDTENDYHQIDACGGAVLLGVGDLTQLRAFWRLELDTLTASSQFALDGKALTGLGLDKDGALLVCDETNAVRRVDWDAQTGETVFSWSENAQTSAQNYQRFYELDDAWIALQADASAVRLYRVYDGAPPEKIRLTLTEIGNFLVDDFNRANETYEIELIPATDDWSSDRLRIQAELTEHPSDLYAGFLDELPLNGQAFVDLKPWLEADGETGPALVPSVRDRLCREGACYALPYEFSLRTWLGERALFDHAGVTVEELDEIVAASGYDYALYAATALCNACPEISAIVLEEGAGYLNDQLTARQAAENIQSRVYLYLMEQAG